METDILKQLLHRLRAGEISVDEVTEQLATLPFRLMEDAAVDTHRALRLGFPEVVFGQGKTADQVVRIAAALAEAGSPVLVTRVNAEQATAVTNAFDEERVNYDAVARAMLVADEMPRVKGVGTVAVIAAGTSDLPVAREAVFTARALGNRVDEIFDVGVAGVHRLLAFQDKIREANVNIVVAGMEGALPSVVGGLVRRPVIAVPTSVGYGASFNGIAALLGMLNSCSPGVTVVNIDNGFGAAYAAALINAPVATGEHPASCREGRPE